MSAHDRYADDPGAIERSSPKGERARVGGELLTLLPPTRKFSSLRLANFRPPRSGAVLS